MNTHSIRPWEIFSELYIGDYFADTLNFSADEHNVFRLLLMRLWLTGSLPATDEVFAQTVGVPVCDCRALQETLGQLLASAAAKIESWKTALRPSTASAFPPNIGASRAQWCWSVTDVPAPIVAAKTGCMSTTALP